MWAAEGRRVLSIATTLFQYYVFVEPVRKCLNNFEGPFLEELLYRRPHSSTKLKIISFVTKGLLYIFSYVLCLSTNIRCSIELIRGR